MTDQAKDLIKAAHNLLGKTNTVDFDNIRQVDAVIKAMKLLRSVLDEPKSQEWKFPEWEDIHERVYKR